jgi:Asp-tRNA(Asn)/Glu-tRNA(Gln) amidotransferase C subunit
MSLLPIWAKKPTHKKKVIATSKGWVVEETGEVLSSYKRLDEKLEELFKEVSNLDVLESDFTDKNKSQVQPVRDDNSEQPKPESESKEEKGEDKEGLTNKPKRRGRPPKK